MSQSAVAKAIGRDKSDRTFRNDSTRGSSTTLTADELALVRTVVLAAVGSRGEALQAAPDLDPPTVFERFTLLADAVRILRAAEHGTFDEHAADMLRAERDYLLRDASTETAAMLAKLNTGGVAALAGYHDEYFRTHMSVADLLEDVAGLREQTARQRVEAGLLTGVLDRIGGES